MKRIIFIIIATCSLLVSCVGNKDGKAKSDETAKADLTFLHFSKIDTSLVWRYKFDTKLKMNEVEKFFQIIDVPFDKISEKEVGITLPGAKIPYEELGHDGSPLLRKSNFQGNLSIKIVKGGVVLTARDMKFVDYLGETTTLPELAWDKENPDSWIPMFTQLYAPLIEDYFLAAFDFDYIKSELSTYE